MTDMMDSNEVERDKLLPVAYCLAAGYVVVMLIGLLIGGSIY